MSIRPIDMQVLIPRATDVGKTQQIIDQQSINQQQQFAEQWQQIAESRQHKIQSSPKSEGAKVQRDSEHESQGQDSSRNGHSSGQSALEAETNQASNEDPILGHVIDIKL